MTMTKTKPPFNVEQILNSSEILSLVSILSIQALNATHTYIKRLN